MDIIRQIEAYQPYNEQEARDRAAILQELQTNAAVFERSSVLAHMTASAWTVNAAHDRVLMVYHNIYHSWSWLGGHADGEESGATGVRLALPGIFSIESLTVDGHEKRGAYVSSHLHLNVTYLIEADEGGPLAVKADENSAVRWFVLDEAVAASTEPWFQARVYRKLNEKLRALR